MIPNEAEVLQTKPIVLLALPGIAVQYADDGYSRRGNFGGSLFTMF